MGREDELSATGRGDGDMDFCALRLEALGDGEDEVDEAEDIILAAAGSGLAFWQREMCRVGQSRSETDVTAGECWFLDV